MRSPSTSRARWTSPRWRARTRRSEDIVERKRDDGESFSALAFKIMSDPHVGNLTYLRVYSGTLEKGAGVINATQGPQGAHRPHPADARQQPRGQGSRLRGRHRRRRGPQADTDRRHALRRQARRSSSSRSTSPSRSSRSPIEPKTKDAQDKLGKALQRCRTRTRRSRSTPTKRPARPSSAAMGELHLEVLVDRMLREFKVDANVGKPQVAYRETISQDGREGRHELRPPDRRQGPVRPRRHRPRAHRPRWRLRVRRQDHRWRDPEGVHPVDRRRHPGRAAVRRPRRLPDGRHAGDARLTARTTTSTRRRWRSRSPARWRSRRRPRRPSPSCSSRS